MAAIGAGNTAVTDQQNQVTTLNRDRSPYQRAKKDVDETTRTMRYTLFWSRPGFRQKDKETIKQERKKKKKKKKEGKKRASDLTDGMRASVYTTTLRPHLPWMATAEQMICAE